MRMRYLMAHCGIVKDRIKSRYIPSEKGIKKRESIWAFALFMTLHLELACEVELDVLEVLLRHRQNVA